MDRWNKAVDQTLAARDENGIRAVSPKSGFPVRPQKFPASAEEIPCSPARAPFLTAFDVGKIAAPAPSHASGSARWERGWRSSRLTLPILAVEAGGLLSAGCSFAQSQAGFRSNSWWL